MGSVLSVCYTTCHTQAWTRARDLDPMQLQVRHDGALGLTSMLLCARCPTNSQPFGVCRAVSDDPPLFPHGLDLGLDVETLADTDGIQSCFLRKEVRMSSLAAAHFAKQLKTALVYTVGDFLHLTREACAIEPKPNPFAVQILDQFLQQFAGLSENRHAAPGTAVPTWLLHVVWCHSLAHPTGVVWFYYAYHAATCTNVLSCTVSLAMSLLV